MATDETTEETAPPRKETSMDDQAKKIKAAGIEETPAGETLEEEKTSPEPKAKTPEELKQNPHDALDINDVAVDALPVNQVNPEILESMKAEPIKNANADGDTVIKKDGQDVKNGGGYYEDSPPAIEDKVKGKQAFNADVNYDTLIKMGAYNPDIIELAGSTEEKKKQWESLTGGATHKITACMTKMKGHVDDPGAFCQSLAQAAGYKPE